MPYAIGLDIGVTNLKAAGVSPTGQLLFRQTFETHAESPDWPARVTAHLAQLESTHGPAKWLGIASPGVARPDGASIRWMQGRLAEVQNLNWSRFLHDSTQLAEARPVPVLNDAQAALLGEAWLGAGQGVDNAILLTLGTGVGGAAIVDGRLLRGHLGRAGHLGHICLDLQGEKDIANTPGSLETKIGNYSLPARSNGRFHSTHDLVQAAQNGDPAAQHLWDISLDALACAIISLINILDPQIVIIGGGIAVAGPALFEPLEKKVRPIEWTLEARHVPIVPAQLGEFAGAIGAAHNALQGATQP
ncbi:MAG: glkA [Phycisphaerales bacterium]|nr:glkA [Phycisphaerales bacterium]